MKPPRPPLPRRFATVALVCLPGFALPAAPLDSTISAVTVYPDRALVTRTAELSLPAGESTVTLSGLPANLWDDSLQVRGSGPAGTTLLDVSSRNVFVESEPNPAIRPLEEQLQALRTEDKVLADQAEILNRQLGVLNQIVNASTTPPAEGPAAPRAFSDWQDLLTFSAENQTRIATAHREIARQRETLAERIAATQAQLNEARGRTPGRRAVKEVAVRLSSPTAGPGQLTLTYTTPGAHWNPVYNARLDSTTREVGFDYQAQVSNRTGEAWHQVALTLSTARPSAGGAAPEAQPWIVAQADARARFNDEIQLSAFSVRSAPAAAEAKAMLAAPAADLAVAEATVETGLTAATFRIAAPASIPADGTTQKVTVTTVTLPAGLRYDSTPKLTPSAFLSATVRNTTAFPLLGGQLAAFVDGAFIANSTIDQTMPGEDFELALGVDEAVAITRTVTNRFVEKTGFTNSGTRVTYEIKLELTNHKSVPVTLRLAEPLPVSRHEKIVVKIIEPAERDIATAEDKTKAFHRDDEGILTWTGSLAPGISRTLALKFSIEHPNDLPVTGVE